METPAQASRATVARHTSRTHRVVNDVEVGGPWRLHHPPRSIFVLSKDRGIAGVSASSALRDGSPSSLSPTYPYTLSTARRPLPIEGPEKASFPHFVLYRTSARPEALRARCSEGEPITWSHERLLRRPPTEDSLHRRRQDIQDPSGPHLRREPLLGKALREVGLAWEAVSVWEPG